MSHNIIEFSQMLLEYMSDVLSREFYNGKPNPFDLPPLRVVTTVKEIDKRYPGPKIVLASDMSLSCGLSKELLLKWGGDPRSRIVFTDISEPGSLAEEIRRKVDSPPIIVSITKPVKVELSGEELVEYRMEMEKLRKLKEDYLQRKRRQEELSMVSHRNPTMFTIR